MAKEIMLMYGLHQAYSGTLSRLKSPKVALSRLKSPKVA